MASSENFEFDEAMKLARARPRLSVSAEVFGDNHSKSKVVIPNYEKTPQEQAKIMEMIKRCFLFSGVNSSGLDLLVKAFDFKTANPGDVLIKQGDDGDKLYLIESGTVEVTRKNATGQEEFLCNLTAGDYFGELALMYNSPRAATVVAKTEMHLWTLDRTTFNHVVRMAVIKKREKYDSILSKLDLFKKVNPYDRCRLADALVERTFEDETVIKQGEPGSSLFMVLEGQAESFVENKLVKSYNPGDYFGEIGFILKKPRASTVKAKGKCLFVELERENFINLLGPMEDVLNKNIKNYKKVLEELKLENKHLKSL
ncbi:cAMP-dependent protein kinase regulatory subunit, putative [Theileria annulata]|uniref:cAMP-dependent protein kinase regulatory subunit, putative n=1 Tax=Theileria annulata TaxID=5874 RepID=Q4UEK0_THEAN|nr:cAMP-dependent protein kinase regulatory subunit, putative [Theileria annulata]CAI74489.1 cAMP-dependent protein kinase regulatory subunit, putative [Theileria annulata]|eukprot:XP_952221.1 cAMP-dependent protein kinase regulatory subunit, putative [Theileria annulata]